MTIELKNVLEDAFKTGINLFLGAGFSVLAKNEDGQNLPLGTELAKDLSRYFKTASLDLPKVTQIIESRQKEQLHEYLRAVFCVDEFPQDYKNLNNISIVNIFTTNIDDLAFKIFHDSKRYY